MQASVKGMIVHLPAVDYVLQETHQGRAMEFVRRPLQRLRMEPHFPRVAEYRVGVSSELWVLKKAVAFYFAVSSVRVGCRMKIGSEVYNSVFEIR